MANGSKRMKGLKYNLLSDRSAGVDLYRKRAIKRRAKSLEGCITPVALVFSFKNIAFEVNAKGRFSR